MRLLVALEAHLERFNNEVFSAEFSYEEFCKRYLKIFDVLTIVARLKDVDSIASYSKKMSGPNVNFAPIPDYQGPWQYLAKRSSVNENINRAVNSCDAYILRVPGVVGTVACKYISRMGRPYGVEVVGDPWQSLSPGSVKTIFRPLIRQMAKRDLQIQCRKAATAAYVTRCALQRSYPPGTKAFVTNYSSVELPDDAVLRIPSGRIQRLAELGKRTFDRGKPVRLGFLGSMSQLNKAPDIHIKALSECVYKGANLELAMAGDGQYFDEMRKLAKKIGVADRVRFLGRLSGGQEVLSFLRTVDLFLNASRQEGLPRGLIEAMSQGCPAIGSKLAGIQELLESKYLVPVGDASALASKVMTVLKDKNGLVDQVWRNAKISRNYIKSVLEQRRCEHYAALRKRSENI